MSVVRKKGRLWKVINGIIAFIGVGGILALVSFYIEYKDRQESKYKLQLKEWQVQFKEWEKWYPDPLRTGTATLYANGLDLDTSQSHSNYKMTNMDLTFSGGDVGFNSYLRALNTTSWVSMGLIDLTSITYQELKNAVYTRKKHSKSNYFDLFYEHPFNSPSSGHVYFLKTSEGNFSILKILNYPTDPIPGPGHHFSRKLNLHYTTYPNIQYPPRPKEPVKP